MRRLLLASCIAILPGLALAQSDNSASSPPGPGIGQDGGPDGGPGGGWADKSGHRHGGDPGEFLTQFYTANTTHDGHLTLAQAKAAGFRPIVDHFTDIDTAKRGYVTFYDIEAWHLDDIAKHLEQRAGQLRAQDN